MTGTFDVGDLIVDRVVTVQQAEHLHRGQIISFQETSSHGQTVGMISHRIYRVSHVFNARTQSETAVYETKGDANAAPDDNRVLPQEIVGVYEFRVPYAGYVLTDLHQPLVFILLITVPFAVLIAAEARRRWSPKTSPEQTEGIDSQAH